jgi:retron-type reverse transcriptase
MAAKIVIEPVFEADFQPCSYGFRPKRSAKQAMDRIFEVADKGGALWVKTEVSILSVSITD